MLFSHCWLCDGRQFPQAAAVARAGYRVLNLDNRGHGRSGPCRTRHTMWDVADDLIAVLDDAGEERAVLVGLSIGGYAGLRAALRHPSRVRALVLAGTTAGQLRRWDLVQIRCLWRLFRTRARSLALAPFVNVLFGSTTRRLQPDLVSDWRRRWLDQLARDPETMLATGAAALFRHEDLTSELGTITQPTLVIVGRLEGAAVQNSLQGRADPTVVRALVEGTVLMWTRSIAFATTGLFMAAAGYAILASEALPRSTGWLAVISPDPLRRLHSGDVVDVVDPTVFYNPPAGGRMLAASLPPLIWRLASP